MRNAPLDSARKAPQTRSHIRFIEHFKWAAAVFSGRVAANVLVLEVAFGYDFLRLKMGSTTLSFPSRATRSRNDVDPLYGARITVEEKSNLRRYIGIGFVVLLTAGDALLLLSHAEREERDQRFRPQPARPERHRLAVPIKGPGIFRRTARRHRHAFSKRVLEKRARRHLRRCHYRRTAFHFS